MSYQTRACDVARQQLVQELEESGTREATMQPTLVEARHGDAGPILATDGEPFERGEECVAEELHVSQGPG